MPKSYSDEKKDEILKFALAQGRGGIGKAAIKYQVSYASVRNWLGGTQPSQRRPRLKFDGRKARRLKRIQQMVRSLEKQVSRLEKVVRTIG